MAHVGAMVKIWRLDPLRKVSRYGRKRLIQGIATVEAATQWMEDQGPGVYLLDEGPLRVLMDYACHSEPQLNVWHRYSVEALKKLEACQILVVRVLADDESRFQRRKRRMSRLEQGDPTFDLQADRVEVRKVELMFNREWIVEKINNDLNSTFSMITVNNYVDVTQAASEILGRIAAFAYQSNGRG
ncbi:hypothetical protein [Fodinicurvata sp. EGI_FJ10296]|uniref:hypothetical protein n=1 Tax=Fodinicurvata sp. EGI_FJ10296 TaxID=3231908 RepID=UPI0034569E4C